MIESVIVTVCLENREFDMELPAKIKFARVKTAIADALLRKGVRVNDGAKFLVNGYPIKDTDTLLDVGVWDGCHLKIA